jgi:hypothetical protein
VRWEAEWFDENRKRASAKSAVDIFRVKGLEFLLVNSNVCVEETAMASN